MPPWRPIYTILVTSLPATTIGPPARRWPLKSFGIAVLTGLLEPVGGLFGSTMVWLAEPIMPWTLGFAAGAMLFIISDEIIPETHRGRFKTLATFSLLGGFVIMMFLDATLG